MTKAQQAKKAKYDSEMVMHTRYAELEKAIDAMYDLPGIDTPEWNSDKFGLEAELEDIKCRLSCEGQ